MSRGGRADTSPRGWRPTSTPLPNSVGADCCPLTAITHTPGSWQRLHMAVLPCPWRRICGRPHMRTGCAQSRRSHAARWSAMAHTCLPRSSRSGCKSMIFPRNRAAVHAPLYLRHSACQTVRRDPRPANANDIKRPNHLPYPPRPRQRVN